MDKTFTQVARKPLLLARLEVRTDKNTLVGLLEDEKTIFFDRITVRSPRTAGVYLGCECLGRKVYPPMSLKDAQWLAVRWVTRWAFPCASSATSRTCWSWKSPTCA